MSRKLKIMKYFYDLITGRHLRELQTKAMKQDSEINDLCATLNGESTWMLEESEPTKEYDKGGKCTG